MEDDDCDAVPTIDLGTALAALTALTARHGLPTGTADFDGHGWNVRLRGARDFAAWLPAIGAAHVGIQTRTVHSVVMGYGTAGNVPVTLESSITRKSDGSFLPGLRVTWTRQTKRAGMPPRRQGVATAADFLSAVDQLAVADQLAAVARRSPTQVTAAAVT